MFKQHFKRTVAFMVLLTCFALAQSDSSQPLRALPVEKGKLFNASGNCAICHTGITDESGADVSIGTSWRSTMMGNSARDPYWLATVRSEVIQAPQYRSAIEKKCATCHMPMGSYTAMAEGETAAILDDGFTNPRHKLHVLAMEGVSCTLCHQIKKENLGKKESFSGHYEIDVDHRVLYGPFEVDTAQSFVMKGLSGFVPKQSEHIKDSKLCATCHTLYTEPIDESGKIVGTFPEQTPYLEWLHSDYRENRSCQSCHMIEAQGAVKLSKTGGKPRKPFYLHAFMGGNVFMLKLLKKFGDELGVKATDEQFDATIANTLNQLQKRTAAIRIENVSLTGSQMTWEVTVRNKAGHKFPSAYPSRRAWLHIVVNDSGGNMIFESGAAGSSGYIQGNDNDKDPKRYEPHYTEISQADQVQIYEAIMLDTKDEVTTTLMRAAQYAKDNRLLPAGFDKEKASKDIAVHGKARIDGDFAEGGDRVRYKVNLGDALGPFTVKVELMYQSIGYRWATNLGRIKADEIDRFVDYYKQTPNYPVTVAYDQATIAAPLEKKVK